MLGFAQLFNLFAGDAVGFEGTISTRTERLGSQVKQNQSAQERMSQRIDQYRARLLAQYTALDANMGRMTSLADYVSQQMSMLANSMSSGR